MGFPEGASVGEQERENISSPLLGLDRQDGESPMLCLQSGQDGEVAGGGRGLCCPGTLGLSQGLRLSPQGEGVECSHLMC